MIQFLAFPPINFTHFKANSVSLAFYSTANAPHVEGLAFLTMLTGHTSVK